MGVAEILASVDREIAVLQQARALLTGGAGRPGRPKASGLAAPAAAKPARRAGKKRRLSAEGRRRISEAAKRRWEERRKAPAAQK
jgi:hypothetical protein